MKDILIVSHFVSTELESGNDRFIYIANFIKKNIENVNVEILTSDFSHFKKQHRSDDDYKHVNFKYKLKMIHELGYKKNVSIKRIISHFFLGRKIVTYLNNRKNPDLIYCAVPSLSLAYEVSKYAKKNNINFIIDIQDLWPEAFKMVFNIPLISNIIFYPMERLANKIYNSADKIVAVSDTYRDRALKINNNDIKALTIFLGTDLDYFDQLAKKYRKQKKDNEFWITYIGTLGHSYDIKLIIDVINIIKNKGITNIKFMIIGDGPLRKEFEDYAKEKQINVEFTGKLEYGEMIGFLIESDLAVNPIKKGAASIINKVADYAAAGLPVLNTQESLEYRNLVDKFNIGINCNNNNLQDIVDSIEKIYYNKSLRYEMGKNNRKLAELKFDRKITYKNIEKLILDEV